jgi:hypothetical protein
VRGRGRRRRVAAASLDRRATPAAASDWARLIRALAATDDDELPLFGRLAG